ncbi:MAG: alpha/beta hydrolase [Prevotellaceae bacterium]|jgi:pimeloyl-ACP methyl ester carboxylesterase|nr:alpha/beta hydrolase [Prevotellaceae bacterium]
MKSRLILLLTLLIFTVSAQAQMDDKFYYPDKQWIAIDSVDYEEIILKVDKDTIHSILVKPNVPVKATILFFHGNGGNVSKWLGHFKPLLKEGFQVGLFDYRGYGKSTGTPTHLNIASDARLWVEAMLQRDEVKNIPIIVYGASIGTQVATLMAREYNDAISGLVVDGMMASFTDVALATSPNEYHEQIKAPLLYPEEFVKYMNWLNTKSRLLDVHYLKEGKLITETIPLDFINEKGEIESPYINSLTFVRLDSVVFEDNHPDQMELFSTPVELDFRKEIKSYSPEYYAANIAFNVTKAIEYYNWLFGNEIEYDSQTIFHNENYKAIEVMFGDMALVTTPRQFIIEPNSNPSPSIFFHEVGHRAFWYLQDELGIKFKGLSYVHMGLLEYFTVSLNDSPVVGEDILPVKGIRNASWTYSYPPADSLSLKSLLDVIADSYPEKMKDPNSNIAKFHHAYTETYKDFYGIIDNHRGGMIITSTLWRIREQLGQGVTDKLISQTILSLNDYIDERPAFYYPAVDEKLPDKIEWYDLYYGLIQKDKELNSGKGKEIIYTEFRKTEFPVEKVNIK